MEKLYNYIYKISNVVNQTFYIGIHSTNNLNDNYFGSGKRLKYSIDKYGLIAHTKEILRFFSSREDLLKYESEIVTNELVHDQKCLNLKNGGEGGGHLWSTEHAQKFHSAGAIASNKLRTQRLKELWKNEDWKRERSAKIVATNLALGKGRNGRLGIKDSITKINAMKKTFELIGHQKGEKNSMFGKVWITNGVQNAHMNKDDILPEGFRRGRVLSHK
jgi:hypothetical protein